MLSAKNIHKKYGAVEVLRGVDIEVDAGEIVSIVGPSGSGKSTLLHILGTLDKADLGYVDINGVRIESKPEQDILPAPWWKRILNLLIDSFVIGLISNAVFYFFNGRLPDPDEILNLDILLPSLGISIFYYFLFESFTGRTPGKILTRTKVMMAGDFSKPSWNTCLFRTLGRLIPLDVFSFFSKRPQGWHDSFSGTLVSDSPIPYLNRTGLSARQLSQFRNKNIGFVFQFHHLLPEFSALENVCIAGWINNSNKKEVQIRAQQLLKILGLSDRMDHKPAQMSGGEQQRVAVARALINKPKIVFADEPTGNLDTANAKELHELFFDLRAQFKQTFLIVTHNEELARLSDRTLTMKDGKME